MTLCPGLSTNGYTEQFPALGALALFATLVLFFFMWAYTLAAGRGSDPHSLYPALQGGALHQFVEYQIGHRITAIVVRSLVFTGIVLWAARRFALPLGAITFLIVVPSVLVGAMLVPSAQFLAFQLCASVVAGVACDLAVSRLGLLARGSWGSRILGFALPFLFWATYIVLADAQLGGFWWTIHVVYGAPVIGGLAGILLAILMEPRAEVAR